MGAQPRRGNYGFDAPYVPVLLGSAAVALLAYGVLARSMFEVGGGTFLALSTASFVYATRRGKFVLWQRILAGLELRGNESVLDVGCGRGMVLLMAAQLLPEGRAVGVDLWRRLDQSGNEEAATWRNAELAGVRDRVELHTGDMTALPFEADTFDAVVSSLAIHNVKAPADRSRAIGEIARVLRPGGQVVVADIRVAAECAALLGRHGMSDVALRSLGWRGWYGGPWMSTRVVSARGAPT